MMISNEQYKELIHNTVAPATLPYEELNKCYQPIEDFLRTETPEKLYRFRRCDERSIAAFEEDQIWFSPGYRMNDDFDALLHFDKERIKSELKSFLDGEQFLTALRQMGQGEEIPSFLQGQLSSEVLQMFRQNIRCMDEASITMTAERFYTFFENLIDTNDLAIRQITQNVIKFACFSDQIDSAAMWGYYAESSCGFALSYDFRNGGYTMCNSCFDKEQCPSFKSCSLLPMIYDDSCFDATQYATWLFQQRAIQKILIEHNALSHYNLFQNLIPCPDLFMPTKILLHKATDWKHEREWRLICSCNTPDFNQQEFSCAKKKATALYLGRKISPINEKILRYIANEKKIPVYKMQINNNVSSYKLYPEEL